MTQDTLIHWKVNEDDDHILWLKLDREGASANTLNAAIIQELSLLICYIEQAKHLKAVIITSAKASGFIAGADINYFRNFTDSEEIMPVIREGQKVYDRLEQLTVPVIAYIKGFCLGGGCELALACHYRIAVDDPKTRIGLPEVLLGIHPGWGGSIRLPRLIGAAAALDLILSGRSLKAKQAAKLGVVDAAVPMRLAEQVVRQFALNPPKRRECTGWQRYTNESFVRPLLGYMVRRQLKKKANSAQYPAPYALLDNWQKHGLSRAAYDGEVVSLCRMLMTPSCRGLVRVFDLQEKLKKSAKEIDYHPKHVHVIGAGVMGGDIAAWCAYRGFTVSLQDLKEELIGAAVGRAYSMAKKRLKEPHLVMSMMDRLIPDPKGLLVGRADVIIEAVSENIAVKLAVLKAAAAQAKPDALIATNTSTIELMQLGESGIPLSKLIGLHFFNPVEKLPLVEVVVCSETSQDVRDRAVSFARQIDKLPLVVQSAPAFLVNRILLPYMLEATLMLEEGIEGPMIDAAARSFGMPMGPIELADKVGLDVCLAALQSLSQHTGDATPEILKKTVASGRLGMKNGQGFYTYTKGKKAKQAHISSDNIPSDIVDRLILRLLNEAVACLRKGIVDTPEDLDAGSVFGFGFPPFRGGPMHYIQSQGADALRQRLEALAQRYGTRFKPDAWWG
ncbi:MAG: 3-hydroxyacyl-CoA dehydrogenase NAD-binding domain-containing protein [Pseudomonadota bacterium]